MFRPLPMLSLLLSLSLSLSSTVSAEAPPAHPELAVLALEAGTWDADITFPPATPDAEPTHAHGVQVNTLRSGGLWLENRFSVDGTPYEGTGVWGWDSAGRHYTGIWTDNNEQRIRRDEGDWDPSTQTMTWRSEMVQADGRHIPLRFTIRYDGDTRVFDMNAVHPDTGALIPLVDIVFHRRAAATST